MSVTQAKIANLAVGTGQIDNLAVTDGKIASLSADKINAGCIRGINVTAAAHLTKGSYLTAALSGGEGTINIKDSADFPSSGDGWIVDTMNDRDAFSWTGKSAATLTGCSGVLAHNNGATIIPAVKGIIIDAATNEMRFYADRGDGTIDELAVIGTIVVGSSGYAAIFGNISSNSGNSRSGVLGQSGNGFGVVGFGRGSGSYGGFFGCISTGASPIVISPSDSASAPTHSSAKGSLWVTSEGVLYINSSGSTTWTKVGAQ